MEVKNHGNNVKTVLTSTQAKCSEILQEGGAHDDRVDDVIVVLTRKNRVQTRSHPHED